MPTIVTVGMAEMKVSRSKEDLLVAIGLGSCIGVCLYDPRFCIAGMVHVVLPEVIGSNADAPGKYAPTAVPSLIRQMESMGASLDRMRVAIAGGAQLFSFSAGSSKLDIGRRNGDAVQAALQAAGLAISAMDIGGSSGRTISLGVGAGRVRVKTIGSDERDLTHLGGSEDIARAA
jgi:chemotaxis protein CheD